jgi:glucose-1-phosphate cytidylyltransferase
VKVVILAGGLGTRLSEETASRPKPMVEIGERPILWHIMKTYSHYGFSDFVVCLGYKGYVIKEYFSNYFLHMSDVTFDMRDNSMEVHQNAAEPWRVTLVDTGADTQTAGRIKRVSDYIGGETFMMSYGDGVADVDIARLLEFHRAHGKLATITAVQPLGRFGSLEIDDDETVGGVAAPGVRAFQEKPVGDGSWVNGGFFVLEPTVLDRIAGDNILFEREPLESLAADGQLVAYRHRGFWQPMDALRDLRTLQTLWDSGDAPWAVWSKNGQSALNERANEPG